MLQFRSLQDIRTVVVHHMHMQIRVGRRGKGKDVRRGRERKKRREGSLREVEDMRNSPEVIVPRVHSHATPSNSTPRTFVPLNDKQHSVDLTRKRKRRRREEEGEGG